MSATGAGRHLGWVGCPDRMVHDVLKQLLVAGDALTAEDGHLNGPNPSMTLDVREAARSVSSLAELDVQTIVCYHGGVVGEDANGQLRRVVQETSSEHGL